MREVGRGEGEGGCNVGLVDGDVDGPGAKGSGEGGSYLTFDLLRVEDHLYSFDSFHTSTC